MLYLIIEHFRDGDPAPMYRRLRDEGRLVPTAFATWRVGPRTTSGAASRSWCEDEALLTKWTARWEDLIEFEVSPVINVGRSGGHTRASIVKCLRTVCPPHPFPWY